MATNYPQRVDIVFVDAEPHAGHKFGGHDPEKGNICCPFIVYQNQVTIA